MDSFHCCDNYSLFQQNGYVLGFQKVMFYLLFGSILWKFDQYAIYIFNINFDYKRTKLK
jgi:hypothetical protein